MRARLRRRGRRLADFIWSSHGGYLKAPGQRPAWLRTDRLLGEKGVPKDSPAGRREFARQLEERRRQETDEAYEQIRRGGCLGDEEFRQELLARWRGERRLVPAAMAGSAGSGSRPGPGA